MREETKCAQLSKIRNFLELDKPLPPDFIEHARDCSNCLFWTSYALAEQKAVRTINRIVDTKSVNCPNVNTLRILLIVNISEIKAGYAETIIQNIFHVGNEDFSFFYELKEHVNGDNPKHCPYCRTYFEEIWNAMVRFQKQYESDILKGGPVRPTIKDTSDQIPADKVMRGIDPSRKPN